MEALSKSACQLFPISHFSRLPRRQVDSDVYCFLIILLLDFSLFSFLFFPFLSLSLSLSLSLALALSRSRFLSLSRSRALPLNLYQIVLDQLSHECKNITTFVSFVLSFTFFRVFLFFSFIFFDVKRYRSLRSFIFLSFLLTV